MAKPYIYVDITSLERSASEIGVFLNNYRKYFGGMDDTMNSLRTSWVSDDYTKFMQQWRIFYSGNSIGVGMRREFSNYKEYLEYAAQQYKKCQSNAYDRVNKLR